MTSRFRDQHRYPPPCRAACFTLCLVLVFLLLIPLPCHGMEKGYAERLHAGTEEASQGDLSAAMADLAAAVQLAPNNPDGWYELGVLYGQIGDFRTSEKLFRHVVQLRPDMAKAHYRLGLTLIANPQSKLDWPGAMAEFRAALKYQPEYPEALNYLGAGLIATGDSGSAIPDLEHALRLEPSLAAAHLNLAMALQATGHLQEAVQEYQAAITTKGESAEASSALGKLLLQMGNPVEAEKALLLALRQNPDLGDAHYALARALQQQKKTREAAVEFAQAEALAQREPDAIESAHISNLALSLAAKGDLAGARTKLLQAIQLRPSYGVPHYNLGLVLADSGDLAGAVRELTLAISLLPGQEKPWFELGRVLQLQGKKTRAFQVLSWAAFLAPGNAEVTAELSSLRAKSFSSNTSRSAAPGSGAVRMPSIGPAADTAEDHFAFASKLSAKGDFQGAVAELLRSLTLQPAQISARRNLAKYYENLGDKENSILEYQKVLLLHPGDGEALASLARLEPHPLPSNRSASR